MNLCCQLPKKEKHQCWKKISMSQRNVTCHPAVILIISLTFTPLNYTDRLVGVHAEVYVRYNRKSLLELNDVVFEESVESILAKDELSESDLLPLLSKSTRLSSAVAL